MYRIAVVDDEPNLVEGLCDMLSHMPFQEIEIFKAYSGKDILSLLHRTSLDIIISDIRMPGISGLNMLAWVEQICPKCRVIFLTGYDTFAWVQEALRHPCCVDYLHKDQGDDAVIGSISRQLENITQERSPETLLRRVIAQRAALRPIVIQQALSQWLSCQGPYPTAYDRKTDMDEPTLLCLFCRAESGTLGTLFHATLTQLCADHFLLFPQQEVIAVGWEKYALLAQRGSSVVPLEQTYSYIRTQLETVQQRLDEVEESVFIAFREALFPLYEAPEHMMTLQTILAQKKLQTDGMIFEESRIQQDEKECGVLLWIKEYVRTHIDDVNLSLTTIANDTYYAPAYLSRLFKAQTGMTFSTYVAKVRIEVACQLLRDGEKTVQQVGRSVGFESPSSFGAFFKRQMNMTPAQYMRDLTGR